MPEEIFIFGPSFVGASLIAFVHVFIRRFHFLDKPNSLWPDFLAGVALGYVFVDILPHLAGKQETLRTATDGGLLGFLEHHAYLVAMGGFLFYLAIALSRGGARSQRTHEDLAISDLPIAVQFSATSLAAYALLVGYMLAEQCTHGTGSGLVFALAMSAHFAGLDHFYRRRYRRLYDAGLRYILALAVYFGWALGVVGEVSDPVYALWFAFLSGGIMIITAVFEVPRVQAWRQYAGFCGGAISFSALILLAEALKL